jgi:cytochrome c biogenesis factor
MRWYVTRALTAVALVALLVLTLVVTSKRSTTNTEAALWTFILFAIGLAVSFYLGQRSVSEAAAEIVRPQARGAARRLKALGRGIQSFGNVIDLSREAARDIAQQDDGKIPIEHLNFVFDTLYIQIESQMTTVVDALEDWREFEPDIVNELAEEGK